MFAGAHNWDIWWNVVHLWILQILVFVVSFKMEIYLNLWDFWQIIPCKWDHCSGWGLRIFYILLHQGNGRRDGKIDFLFILKHWGCDLYFLPWLGKRGWIFLLGPLCNMYLVFGFFSIYFMCFLPENKLISTTFRYDIFLQNSCLLEAFILILEGKVRALCF